MVGRCWIRRSGRARHHHRGLRRRPPRLLHDHPAPRALAPVGRRPGAAALLPREELPGVVLWSGGVRAASGLKVLSFNLGPFTVLASVFVGTALLNLVFGRWLLGGGWPTPRWWARCWCWRACVCVVDAPSGADVLQRLRDGGPRRAAALWRLLPRAGARRRAAQRHLHRRDGAEVSEQAASAPVSAAEAKGAPRVARVARAPAAPATPATPTAAAHPLPWPRRPPRWLGVLMVVVYPPRSG